MSPSLLVTLLLFLFPLAFSPGPGNAFFAGIGASRGLRAAVPALTGYHLATFLTTALIGLLGATLLGVPAVATTLSAAGSLYVLWLAVNTLRSTRARRGADVNEPVAGVGEVGFLAGVLVLLLNPKAYYIIAVMFAQFLKPTTDSWLMVLSVTTIFTLNNLVAFISWTVGGRALTLLFRTERSRRRIDYSFAFILVGVAIWMGSPVIAQLVGIA
jgi:threonine/homoserine/homoserine lactone efflux protein